MKKVIEKKLAEIIEIVKNYQGNDKKTISGCILPLYKVAKILRIKDLKVESYEVDKGKYEFVIKQTIELFKINPTELIVNKITNLRQLQKALICKEYDMMAKKQLQYKEIKKILSKKYGWSISAIEKLVYGKSR